jgi:propionyl-CoA carboxylase beta chain
MKDKIEELNDKIAQAHLGGGKIELQKTTPKKKLTPESELTI